MRNRDNVYPNNLLKTQSSELSFCFYNVQNLQIGRAKSGLSHMNNSAFYFNLVINETMTAGMTEYGILCGFNGEMSNLCTHNS